MNIKNEPKLTIFTPAYNRDDTLEETYNSLCHQTNKNFVWLIVDDGSTDNTQKKVEEWQKNDNGFGIRYIYKENGGMHTAHNTAYENIDTELNVCIDSDDFMPYDAVEKILSFWEKYGNGKYAGIVGLDQFKDGKIIGTKFNEKETTLSGFYARGGKGDKKLVYRTDIINKYPPYPVFEGEKYVALAYKYILCDQDYKLLTMNEPLVTVEYREDGSSRNMYRQYMKNPKGFAFYRKVCMMYQPKLKRRFIECIHYVSSCRIAKEKNIVGNSPKRLMTLCAYPLGVLLEKYIKCKQNQNMKIEG